MSIQFTSMQINLVINQFNRFTADAKKTLWLGLPIIIAHLLQMSMVFVDTIMVGNVSSQNLAALALATAIYSPVFLLMLGVFLALGSIISQLYGAGKTEEIMKNMVQGFWLSQLLAFISILALLNLGAVLHLMNYDPELIQIAEGYLSAICWGMPPLYAYLVLRMFAEGLSMTRPSMFIAFVGLLTNMMGNYTLIFGHFGFPALGAVGAGYATSLVHITMFAAILLFFLKASIFQKYRDLFYFSKPIWVYLRKILVIGIPNGLSIAFEVGLFSAVALFMGTFGVVAIASHQIAINIASVTFMVPMGLSNAITIRVGQEIGKQNYSNARFSGYSGVILCIMVMAVAASLFIFIPELLIGLYTKEEQVMNLAVQLLFMAAIFQLSDGMQVGAIGALRGLNDTRVPLAVNILAYWGIGLPLAYGAGVYLNYGPTAMWGGLIAGLSVAAVLHSWRFRILTQRLVLTKSYSVSVSGSLAQTTH